MPNYSYRRTLAIIVMKQITFTLFILLSISSCKPWNGPNSSICQEFADSLTIRFENTALNVALINLKQEQKVKPNSIVFDNHLLVLNTQNIFYVFDIECFNRDLRYEEDLNTMEFNSAFILSNTLYAINASNQVFYYSSARNLWVQNLKPLPFFNNEPIFENNKFVCYSMCGGEFGGIVYFLNKETQRITFMPAQCAVSLIEDTNSSYGFYIVSSLSHIIEHSSIMYIENPDSLFVLPDTLYSIDKWDELFNYYPFFIENPSFFKKQTIVFDKYEILFISGFKMENINLYLTEEYIQKSSTISLVMLRNDSINKINVSDTIFSNILNSQYLRTKSYNNITTIDYATYNISSSNLNDQKNLMMTYFLKDDNLIKISWD